MQKTSYAIPPDCFSLEELQAFQGFEAEVLTDVQYYFWLNTADADSMPRRFLYALELIFDQHGALLLSSGEDSTAIRIISAETLIKTARDLQTLHGRVSVQRIHAAADSLWQPALNQALHAVRLSRNTDGLYLNDALVLDFGAQQILVHLSQREGLELKQYT
ncbi:MAG: hypothetical protein IPM98_22280 [Lewinellaceae bacterium]|nr:hypothetical protein [Lewinellaceae bacterium]